MKLIFIRTIVSFSLALVGVGVFQYFDFPLPWLLGSIFPLIIGSRFKLNLIVPNTLIHPSRAMLGVAIGASFTPALLGKIDTYLISLVFMLPFLLLVILAGQRYYHQVVGYGKSTSVFCALPGGLLEMAILSDTSGANTKAVILAHTTRVLIIIYLIPFLIQNFTPYDLSGNFVNPGGEMAFDFFQATFVLAIATLGWFIARKLKLGGASIVGPMTFCAIIYLFGWVDYKFPGWLLNLAQLILGMRIGLSLTNITFKEVALNTGFALGFLFVLMSTALLTAYIVHLLTDLPLITSFLAFVPGGQAEMNLIAIVIGLHVPYIALHHVTRMFLVIAFAPTIKKWLA